MMKKLILIIAAVMMLTSAASSKSRIYEEEYDRLTAANSLRCTFTHISIIDWTMTEFKLKTGELTNQWQIEIVGWHDGIAVVIYLKKDGTRDYPWGDLSATISPEGNILIEQRFEREGSALGFLTVYPRYLPGTEDFFIVYSRHQKWSSGSLGNISRPTPSQFYGSCKIIKNKD